MQAYQKVILYLRVEQSRIFNFLFQNKGVDIFQLQYSSIDNIFFEETFKVKWSYSNNIIFH